jgi:tetratricopeptide (TPR) repeat protein
MENITTPKTRFIALHDLILTPERFKQISEQEYEVGILENTIAALVFGYFENDKEILPQYERPEQVVSALLDELQNTSIKVYGYVNYFWDAAPSRKEGSDGVEYETIHFLLECNDKLYRERLYKNEYAILHEHAKSETFYIEEVRKKRFYYNWCSIMLKELQNFGQIILASIILFLYIFCTSSLTAQTTKPMTNEQRADEHYKVGLAASRKPTPDTSAALYHFSQAITLNPRHALAAKWLSWVHEQMHNDIPALYQISRYLSLEQSDAKAYFRRAVIHLRLQHITEAFADFSEAVRLAENEQDKGVFLEYRANLFDTLAAADRRLLNNIQQQRTIQQEGR